jgi:bifunctional enzyme CysN/CysC
MEMLRLATAGSVDDGKSSLIGRLLYDSKSIFEDQLLAIEQASERRGSAGVELALLTDGLRAEREQNITIDVAYRYFNTPKRKFIIADTPGHVQYTRNMVTGTSTADLSVILVDARKGVLPQSKRHAAISALLRTPEVLVAVNKMDLVDFSEDRFREILTEFRRVASRLDIGNVTFVPISALLGDNVVDPSENMPWYHGPTFLEFLETVRIPKRGAATALRLPVQYVVRPTQDYRGLAGEIRAGDITVGEQVVVLPAGVTTTVKSVRLPSGEAPSASVGQAVVVELADDVDVSRGDLIASHDSPPVAMDRFEATICWLGDRNLLPNSRYLVLHANRRVQGFVESIRAKVDIEELEERSADQLSMNDIGRIVMRTTQPIYVDSYAASPDMGSFVLVDPADYVTVGAGMIDSIQRPAEDLGKGAGKVVWLTGASASRRSTLAAELGKRFGAVVLDELDLGTGLNEDLPNIEEAERRLAAITHLLANQNRPVIVSAWHPSAATRQRLSEHHLEMIRLGTSETGEDIIPESFDDDWLVDAVVKRFADGI